MPAAQMGHHLVLKSDVDLNHLLTTDADTAIKVQADGDSEDGCQPEPEVHEIAHTGARIYGQPFTTPRPSLPVGGGLGGADDFGGGELVDADVLLPAA